MLQCLAISENICNKDFFVPNDQLLKLYPTYLQLHSLPLSITPCRHEFSSHISHNSSSPIIIIRGCKNKTCTLDLSTDNIIGPQAVSCSELRGSGSYLRFWCLPATHLFGGALGAFADDDVVVAGWVLKICTTRQEMQWGNCEFAPFFL